MQIVYKPEFKDCSQSTTVMHRLDIVTFGLMVMALNKPAHRHISKQFERRETAKTYQAIFFMRCSNTPGK